MLERDSFSIVVKFDALTWPQSRVAIWPLLKLFARQEKIFLFGHFSNYLDFCKNIIVLKKSRKLIFL